MKEIAFFFGAKLLAYVIFFLVIAAALRVPNKPIISLKAAFHRLWLGVASAFPVIFILFISHSRILATASIWVFRAGTWFVAFTFPFSRAKPSTWSKVWVVAGGLALNLGFDLALMAIDSPGHGGRFEPSLGWWELGLC